MAAVAAAVAGVLHPLPRRPGRHLRPDRTAPSGAASRRARAVARRRDRARNGRRAGRATRRCRVRPRLPRPHRAPMGCSDFIPVRCRCAARGTNPTCSVGRHSLIAADYPRQLPWRVPACDQNVSGVIGQLEAGSTAADGRHGHQRMTSSSAASIPAGTSAPAGMPASAKARHAWVATSGRPSAAAWRMTGRQ